MVRPYSLLKALLFAATASASAIISARQDDNHWVSTWTSMPQLVEPNNLPPAPFTGGSQFNAATLRQTLHMTLSAPRIRIQISNTFGTTDLPITAASIANPVNNAAGVGSIDTASLKKLTFNGKDSITIPRGTVAYTDPIDFPIKPQQNIAVSLYLASGQSGNQITGHPGSRTTSWMQSGNHINAANVSGGKTVHWYFISVVEAWTPKATSALVILGDSITDGRGSDDDKNNRWPDLLLAKFIKNGITTIAINNQAAGGNCVLSQCLGPSLLSRYKRDALDQQGVKYVMIFEGVNDIGNGGTDSGSQQRIGDQLISAFTQISRDAKAKGLKVFAATITPLGTGYTGGSREQTRQRVNQWILQQAGGIFDAVIDFDKIVRDPSNASKLARAYDGSGDGLHPNVAGFQAIADAFPLNIFNVTPGTPTTSTSTTATGSTTTSTTTFVPTSTVSTPTSSPTPTVSPGGTLPKYSQCAGNGWQGSGFCVDGTVCNKLNDWYSQCL
ncbi:SGNH hydrolase [Ascobolus immersus RN42]|uniref:SGNH hydrolase n=1 Tax=Ascobolus immersus RN42 TaxID=1160509 RepID=A0A3N4I189_ASCIM|nr:SGNH hydrolase [Ascobolus immersus RN42]